MFRSAFNNPIETLVHYIQKNDLEKFNALLDIVAQQAELMGLNLYQTVNDRTLYQHAIFNGRREFFDSLVRAKITEKGYDNRDVISLNYVRHLSQYLIKNNHREFDVVFDLLMAHKNTVIEFDPLLEYQNQTLFQFAVLGSYPAAQKFIELGIGMNLMDSNNEQINLSKKKFIGMLLERNDLTLTPAHYEKIFIYCVRHSLDDAVWKLLREKRVINLDVVDESDKSALVYAASRNDMKLASYLLANGALSVGVIQKAVLVNNQEMIELLLLHGAGLFQDIRGALLRININAAYCYVEGLSVEGVPVTPKTKGFEQAIFTAAELAAYRKSQDNLTAKPKTKLQPFPSLNRCFQHLEVTLDRSAYPAFAAAYQTFQQIPTIPKLKFMAATVMQGVDPGSRLNVNGVEMRLDEYLNGQDLLIAKAVLGVDDDQQYALATINDRIDELQAFYNHLQQLGQRDARHKVGHEHVAAMSTHLLYATPSVYALYAACVPCGEFCGCCGGGHQLCSCPYVTQNAMPFFGIPGMVTAGIVVLSTVLVLAYAHRYGCDSGICCGGDGNEPLARRHQDIATALDALSAILRAEGVPPGLGGAFNVLVHPTAKFSELLTALGQIKDYYAMAELKNIENRVPSIAYRAYQSGLFFWDNVQHNHNRNVKLPPRLKMDENDDLQHLLGYQLFEMMPMRPDSSADLPGRLEMIDAGDGHHDNNAPAPTESTPLFKHKPI